MKAARWRRKVSPARWNPAFTIGAGATLVYLAVLAPGIYSIDGNAMLGLTESLIRHFSIVLPPDCAGVIGRGGHLYSMWYPLLSFVAIPFVLVGMALAHVLHLPEHFVSAVCALTLSAVLTGATTALVALVAVRLGANWRGAWLAAIAYAFGTIALCYARSFYCEPLLAFLTVAGMWLAMSEVRRRILWITVCAALAVLAKPPGIILGPILSAYFFAKRRPWAEIIAPTFGAATGFVLYGIYNFVRFGSALNFGQPTMFSLRYVPVGVAGLLFSPGRGFVWYCVPLLLFVVALPRAIRLARLEAAMIAVMFLGCLGLYSCWMSWPGGWSWGPRFLLPVLPGLAALLGLLQGKWVRVLALCTAAGFIVNAPTLVSYYERYYAEANQLGIGEHAQVWSVRDAPLLHAWGAAYRELQDARRHDVRELFQARRGPAANIASSRALRVVALWWWVLPIAHIPRWIGAALSLAVLFAGLFLLRISFLMPDTLEARGGVLVSRTNSIAETEAH